MRIKKIGLAGLGAIVGLSGLLATEARRVVRTGRVLNRLERMLTAAERARLESERATAPAPVQTAAAAESPADTGTAVVTSDELNVPATAEPRRPELFDRRRPLHRRRAHHRRRDAGRLRVSRQDRGCLGADRHRSR